ncbi:MAG: hypothetical protein CL930_15075 [Deltaproteobacteria bacterium]|nr:hypothetical protein [Deltaproteobacteria bacterium]MAY82088.1 hypothetical protein [Deltaproteobacteria bacterium]|tara:strand:- start:290 stop:469 length:180 start_codon:yes stop_codon:yes gene_type:complete
MKIPFLMLWVAACTPTKQPSYARTSGPMGVTNNDAQIGEPPQDTGDGDTGDGDTGDTDN